MSLTQHLRIPGPVRTWWDHHTAGLAPYLADLQRVADVPVRRLSLPGPEHAAQVGGIVGRLLETRVELAPPYAAILGAGTRADATLWPTHAHLANHPEGARAVEWRPTPHGWQHLVPGRDHGTHSIELRRAAEIETNPHVDDLDQARAAGIVAALEGAYRSGGRVVPATAEAVADALLILRRQRVSLQRARELCGGRIAGHAAPVFAPHWADGDVLLGPGRSGGYGLVDVKTVSGSTLRSAERTRVWLWQLLSYAAADADEDLWRVRAVGVWLPRQDALVVWPVAPIWEAIGAGPGDLAPLLARAYSQDFRATQFG